MNKSIKPYTKEDNNIYLEVVEQMMDEKFAENFLAPVDYIKFGLEDYPQIIKRPMDLGTVRDRLLANQFTSHQAVLDDIQLIWDNCKQYNVDGSPIYKLAVKCEKQTKKLLEKLLKSTGDNSSKDNKKSSKKQLVKNKNSKNRVNSDVEMDGEENNLSSKHDSNLEKENPEQNEKNEKNEKKEKYEKNEKIEKNEKNEKIEKNEKNQTSSSSNQNQDSNSSNQVKEETEKKLNSSKICQSQQGDVEMSEKEDGDDIHDSFHTSNKEREKLAERIKCLANDGLASVVRLVQKECPSCIEDMNDEKLMIRITEIDRKTYEQINALIDTFLKVRETNQENLGVKKILKKGE